MAENKFPGSNPFAASSPQSGSSARGMQSVVEEEEHDDGASPTASSFPPNVRGGPHDDEDDSPGAPGDTKSPGGGGFGGGGFGNFGNFGFGSSSGGSASAAPEQPQSLPTDYNMNRRTSVSAEVLTPGGADDKSWKAPNHPKTDDQLDRLKTAVAQNFLFSHLDDEQSSQVLGALQERKVPAKDVRVIVQGDAGDYFYVVESGNFDIYVSKTGKVESGAAGMGTKVAASGPGGSFGELALMYNAPRAATVVSTEPSIIWQLDRITFRRIVMDSAFQRRRMYESFLEEVPLLSSLTAYERSKIADALETTKYPAGSIIIREGDPGDKFYILESGQAEAVKADAGDKPLKQYKHGDYFGELALLDDKPRAATVRSTTAVKVATLGKDGFQRLLGPVESIMRRNDPRRQTNSTKKS